MKQRINQNLIRDMQGDTGLNKTGLFARVSHGRSSGKVSAGLAILIVAKLL